MSPQRTVNVAQSVRLLELYWWFLEEGPEGVTFEYLGRAQNEITIKGNLYNIQQIIDWNPPMSQGQLISRGSSNAYHHTFPAGT